MKNRPYFIAEIGVNHEAKISLAKKIILDAKQGGAHAIKLQSYKAEKLASKYAKAYWDKKEEKEENQLKLYKRFDGFNDKDYLQLIRYCKKIKIDFIITPFDTDSINFFKDKVKFFKISSSDITNYPLIEKIAATKKPIILSTGASTMKEIDAAFNLIKKKNKNISLLHCILNYPTKRHNANLNMIECLKNFNVPIGISDHTLAKDSHDILVYAYLKGVKIIEKHFTNDKSKPGNDHFHSFNKQDLIIYNKKIDDLNKILGSKKKSFLKSEIISRKNARRGLFYNKNLKKGHKIRSVDLIALRPNIGISPENYKKILGKKLKFDKKKGQIITYGDYI
jgi:sialic acid synthase SpsE